MSSWLRLYTSVASDKKVQRLPSHIFRHWINTLCVAKENGGQIPAIEDYAYELRISRSEAQEILQLLEDKELLDRVGDELRPHNWQSRQYVSDVSTERVREFRKRRKKQFRNVSQNGSVTHSDYTDYTDTPVVPLEDISDLVSVMMDAHPNPDRASSETIVVNAIMEALPGAINFRAEVEAIHRRHAIMAKSDGWTKQEAQFCPNLAKWIAEKSWARPLPKSERYDPPGPIF